MKCVHCHGEMKKGTAPFHIDRRDIHLTLDTVPAWVCRQCGEVYFDEPEVDTIQELIQEIENRSRKLSAVG